jgi:hypothetical protein
LVIGNLGLEWRVNSGRFKIMAENVLKRFHNIFLMPKTMAFVANVISHLVEIKQEVFA